MKVYHPMSSDRADEVRRALQALNDAEEAARIARQAQHEAERLLVMALVEDGAYDFLQPRKALVRIGYRKN